MVLFQAKVNKHYTGAGLESNEWSNVYTLDADSLGDAETAAVAIMEAEQAVSYDVVSFDSIQLHGPAGVGKTLRVGEPGTVTTPGDGQFLPLWNVVRVVFPTVAAGRPEVKYLRLPLLETDQANGNLSDDILTLVNSDYKNVVAANTAYVSPTGGAHDSAAAATDSRVMMRQVSWHRRARPGFHRGYIPNA